MKIKKAWITTSVLNTLSLESKKAEVDYERIQFHDMAFPANPTLNDPLRHVVVIQGLSDNDLHIIYDTIGRFLYEN